MEFEVRVVGGIESCFVSLPLPLLQTLQSGYLPPVLAIELRCDAHLWQVAWCGSASSSPSSIEIARQYADCIGLSDRTVVRVRMVSNFPKAMLVTIEPLTEDDWEILEHNSELAESSILKQVGIVHEEMRFPLWLHGQTVVTFLVMSTFPQNTVVQLVPGTEVAVAPKRLKNPSLHSSQEDRTVAKAQLRVQDPESRFIYKCEENAVKIDVVFTCGAFIHPETAKKYAFSLLQFAVISPRLLSKRSKKKLQSKGSVTEKDSSNGNLTNKHDIQQFVVRILLSEPVAKGNIMLSQSLRLYLGAELHSWVHVKGCNISVKKEIPQVSISPYNFKIIQSTGASEDSGIEIVNNHENLKRKDALQIFSPLAEMGISDWSMHEKIVAALSSGSSQDGAKETTTKTGETNAKDISSLVIGSKTLIHLKVKNHRLDRHGKVQTSSTKFSRSRNQDEKPSIDVLYLLSILEESPLDGEITAYELEFNKSSSGSHTLRSLDVMLRKLQVGDIVFSHAARETPTDDCLSAAISSLDWMGSAPAYVNYSRLDAGRKWVLFFQDTNGLLFKAIPSALGVSALKEYHVNSLAVPRKAKEAIGGITRLTHQDGRSMVINVEYNQLDPLLRATGNPDGDVNCETGYSPFPGNINQLIFEIGPYLEELSKTEGAIKEFVNPKYKDSTKTTFKSSTRLECMMQDYPKTLPPSARVMDAWFAYAPVKNNHEDAAKVPKGNPYHSATSGEMAIYRANSLILRKAGVKVDDPVQRVFNGQEVDVWPRIAWKPKWGLTFSDIKTKVSGNSSITGNSTLAIKGQSIYLEDLALDGALIVDAVDGAEVKAGGSVQNAGWIIENVDYKDTSVPEEVRIRGFKINKVEQMEKTYGEPGKYSLKP